MGKVIFHLVIISEVQGKYSADLERQTAYADIYVNCNPHSSWESLARTLYKHQEVAAVEHVRSYLPPRGT